MATGAGYSVDVVIPTRGRPQLVVRAVRTALSQTVAPHRVIVVVDGPDPDTVTALAQVADPRLRVVQHETSRRAGAARNTGIAAATADFVAFLDDDDQWLPTKLERQLARVAELADLTCARGGRGIVLGTQARWVDGKDNPVWPTRAPRVDEPVADYLFVRDHAGEGALPTPTLLLDRELAERVPFPTNLATHEEWDWMLDLQRAGARFDVVLEELVEVDAMPRRTSLSSTSGWTASLAWAQHRRAELGPRAYSAFLLTEAARGAVLDGAPLTSQLSIGLRALRGAPRPLDLARFLARPVALRSRRKERQA